MRSLIGMTFLNSSVGQRRLRQNGIVLRLGPVVADRRRATCRTGKATASIVRTWKPCCYGYSGTSSACP